MSFRSCISSFFERVKVYIHSPSKNLVHCDTPLFVCNTLLCLWNSFLTVLHYKAMSVRKTNLKFDVNKKSIQFLRENNWEDFCIVVHEMHCDAIFYIILQLFILLFTVLWGNKCSHLHVKKVTILKFLSTISPTKTWKSMLWKMLSRKSHKVWKFHFLIHTKFIKKIKIWKFYPHSFYCSAVPLLSDFWRKKP